MTSQTKDSFDEHVADFATVQSHCADDWLAGLPSVKAALEFASARHANQYREIDHALFIVHPIEVGQLLYCDRQPPDVVAAGLLHDVLEQTATPSAELRHRFGARVAWLVESVSDTPSIADYEARKRELRDRVARTGGEPLAIFTADKISKVRELSLLPASRRQETLARAKLAHYQSSLDLLRRVAGDLALIDRLDTELCRLLGAEVTRAHGP